MSKYYFRIPRIDELTIHQNAAVHHRKTSIALHGSAGTGKSVVAIYRHLDNINEGKQSQLLTYTTTLALYLQECCANQSRVAALHIDSTFQWLYSHRNDLPQIDELIIDEAQDVDIEKYEKLKAHYKNISYGADEAQKIFQNGASIKSLTRLFPNNRTFTLSRSFRNTKAILQFAFNAFPDAPIRLSIIESCKSIGNKPVMHITSNPQKQIEIILEIIKSLTNEAHSIAILCPFRKHVQDFYNNIQPQFPNATYYFRQNNGDCGCKQISNIHITTFKSAKGLEFDTVIIPNFHLAFDTLYDIVNWRDYYVGVTRARSNLYLLANQQINHIKDFVIENIIR